MASPTEPIHHWKGWLGGVVSKMRGEEGDGGEQGLQETFPLCAVIYAYGRDFANDVADSLQHVC